MVEPVTVPLPPPPPEAFNANDAVKAFNAYEDVIENDDVVESDEVVENDDVPKNPTPLLTLDVKLLPLILPLTCNLAIGTFVPIPTLLPVTTNAFELYVPTTSLSSLNTSNIGKPLTSFTLIKEPLRLSSTLNKDPCVPSTLNTTEPDTSEPLLLMFNLLFGDVVPIPMLLPLS